MVDTPNRGYPQPATGSLVGTWGTVVNTQITDVIDKNISATLEKDVSGSSDVTLTSTEAQNLYHKLTGLLTGNIDYIFPASKGGFFLISNGTTGSFSITVKPSGGTGVVVPQGYVAMVMIDGTNNAAVNAPGVGLVPIATQRLLANTSGSSAIALPTTMTAALDNMIGSTQGQIMYRGASEWLALAVGTAGQFLKTGGAAANPAWAASGLLAIQTFTSSGTYTKTTGARAGFAIITGGGAGGGGSATSTQGGGGGGAAGTAITYISALANGAVTVGTGGAGGAGENNGSAGNNSVFAGITANGGSPGARAGAGGTGGNGQATSGGATVSVRGGYGRSGGTGTDGMGGIAGGSFFGGGTALLSGPYGAGGDGGAASGIGTSGLPGSDGVVVIFEFS